MKTATKITILMVITFWMGFAVGLAPAKADVLTCPEGTVPGWLDDSGEATSCINDQPNWPGDPTATPSPTVTFEDGSWRDGQGNTGCLAGEPCEVAPPPKKEYTTEVEVAESAVAAPAKPHYTG